MRVDKLQKIGKISIVLVLFALVFFLMKPAKKTHSANFTSASATLSNSRFSYKASVATGTSGTSIVDIDADSTDDDTNHLFPKDTICFVNAAESGCIGNKTYTVSSVVDSNTFNTTAALSDTLASTDFVVASQSGSLTITFTTATEVPVGGSLLITIPALDSTGKTSDGIPDTNTTKATNGFDISTLAAGDVTVSDVVGCTSAGWGSATVTAGTASADHTISFTRSTATCAASKAVTVTIDASPGIINPAPITTHTRGQADSYQINIKSRDGSSNTLDESDVTVSPVEGVFVSATVDETLALTVAGLTADTGTYCNITRTAGSPDTTAYSVPWGTLSPTYADATHNTQQTLTVSTNADGGYNVYIEENDQMGKDGVACTGNGGESVNCIQDTVCDGTGCTESTLRDWTADPSSYVGLGYSLDDQTGTDAAFEYNDSGAAFNAKQIADIAASETRQSIMSNAGPVNANAVAVCFRIDITGTQPAGYYYNVVKYTAVPIF